MMQNNQNNRGNDNNGKNTMKLRSDILVLIILAVISCVLIAGVVLSSRAPSRDDSPVTSSATVAAESTESSADTEQYGSETTESGYAFVSDTAEQSDTTETDEYDVTATAGTTEAAAVTETAVASTAASTTTTSAATKTTASSAAKTTAATEPEPTYTKKSGFEPDKITGISTYSDYFIVFDKTYNKVLYEKNADSHCYPASVTKVVTAIVAIENLPLDYEVVVGKEIKMIASDSSKAGIKVGQVYKLGDLLYGLMLPSGNDAAYTIAVNTARKKYGSDLSDTEAVERFMEMCNDKIKSIGAKNTHFSCPDGYHRNDHYTTARDMLKICVYAMKIPTFAKVVGTNYIKVTAVTKEEKEWINTNYMLNGGSKYYYKYVKGIKTGMTDEAMSCLASYAVKEGREIFIMAFHAPSAEKRNNDVLRFYKAVFAQLD